MAVLFPLDDDGHPIPVLGFDYRGTQKLAVGAGLGAQRRRRSRRTCRSSASLPPGYAGSRSATTASRPTRRPSPILFPGQYLDVPLRRGERYVAFVADGEPCDAYIIGRV